MLKYLLYKGFVDIILIFNNIRAVDPSEIKEDLKTANKMATPIWNDQTIPFAERVDRCRKLVDPVLRKNNITDREGEVTGVPRGAVNQLNKIFRRYYVEPDKIMLIGQTTEEAYEVQDQYARQVGYYLRRLTNGKHLESRTVTCLRKVYGRNSVPLLTMPSVSALWKICQSSFYGKVTFLVSALCLACRIPY